MSSPLPLPCPDRRPGDDPAVLLLDANVLIDFAVVRPTVLALLGASLRAVAVLPETVLEVTQLTHDDYARLGIPIEELTPEEYAAAADLADSDTPAEDDLCLAVCRSRTWILATNDGVLRKRCAHAGVSTIWGLELLLTLVKDGALSRTDAESIAWKLHEKSPRHFHKGLLAQFAVELDVIAGPRN